MAHPYAHVREKHVKKAESLIRRAGYKSGGAVHDDWKADGRMDQEAVDQHESHLHKGEPKTELHLDDGEKPARKHLARRARGGATPKHKSKGNTKVNVVVMPQAPKDSAPHGPSLAPPAPQAPRPPMPPQPPHPAPAMPPGGGRPGMGMPTAPMPRPGMAPGMGAPPPGMMPRAKGGFVPDQGGGGGAMGRINKARGYGEGGEKPSKVTEPA